MLKKFILKNTKIKKIAICILIAVCVFCTYKLLTINLLIINFKKRMIKETILLLILTIFVII